MLLGFQKYYMCQENMDHIRNQIQFTLKTGQDTSMTFQKIALLSSLVLLLLSAVLTVFINWLSKKPCSFQEKICIGSTVSKREYEDTINNFLGDISFQHPVLDFDTGLKNRVQDCLKSYGISPTFIERMEPCIETATKIASCTYPFVSRKALEAITIYASYVISIDDLTSEIIPELEGYVTRAALGQVQKHELLRGFSKFLGSQQRLFGSFGGDMIVKGSLEFVSSAVVEQNQDKHMHLSPEASEYLVFFRAKTGVAEPFAFFCFPEDQNPESRDLVKYITVIPSIMLFLGYVNDLLSFYKEELKPEDYPGFIRSHAKAHGLTPLQSLRQTQYEASEVVKKIRRLLSADAAILDNINRFIYGYVFYHLCSGRYRLSELDIPSASEARQRFYQMAMQGKMGSVATGSMG